MITPQDFNINCRFFLNYFRIKKPVYLIDYIYYSCICECNWGFNEEFIFIISIYDNGFVGS